MIQRARAERALQLAKLEHMCVDVQKQEQLCIVLDELCAAAELQVRGLSH